MTGFCAPVCAQDVKSDVARMTKLIKENKNNPAALKDELKTFKKVYKKNAEAITGLGRAYLDVKDTLNAMQMGELAIKINKNYGPGYVLLGDVETAKDNGGAASAWFEQAMMMDPQNEDGYRRYAQVNSKVSPTASVEALEKLRSVRPDYPVDIISAEIYDRAGNMEKAIEYYGKVDLNKMEDYQIAGYATDCFLTDKYEKSLEIVKFGKTKFPRNAGINRLLLFNNTQLKNYDEALAAANDLFNASDSAHIGENDYFYYGNAYYGKEMYDEAIDMFQKTIAHNPDNKVLVKDGQKKISDAYSAKGDLENAVAAYDKYLACLDKVTALDLYNKAKMYMNQVDKVTDPAEKEKLLLTADGVFAKMAEADASNAIFATYNRAHIGFTLDPETKTGAAKPHYEKLVELILAEAANGGKPDNTRLVEAYRYLGYYYLLQDDKATADGYWNKILEIDPENETAKQALGQ